MMKSGQHLEQKQSQKQKLSPQQIQYIKLLQLPSVALEQRVKEEIESNPLLEESNGDELRENSDEQIEQTGDEEELEPVDQLEDEEIDWDELLHESDYERESYSTTYNDNREEWRELPTPYHETLLEDLERQVGLLNLNDREKLIADQIVGSLDSDGYMRRDIEAIIDNIAFNHDEYVTEEDVERVRKKIQRLDPIGVASKSLRECLLVQLENLPESTRGRETAMRIVRDEWGKFEKKHFGKIKKKLKIDDDTLKEAYECIQGLDPKPGAVSDVEEDNRNYIEPDFEVYYQPNMAEEGNEEGEGDFIIKLNNRNVPSLRISPRYKEMWEDLKKKKEKNSEIKETKHFIKDKMEAAQWFIDSIQQRQNTLMNTIKTIVALQEDFFKYGEGLKPMILKDVAERVNLDISTISRVVNGKYVQTRYGVFELKYFFSEGIKTQNGEEVSSREVKNLLKDIIANEDKSNPLSDQSLADKLKEEGFKVARRTVSKYREQMNIPVARLRKQIV